MARNIPLSIDDELLAEIDAVAETTKESRSAVMRRAIREGIGVVKSGGSADVITLDGETSREANKASQETQVSRAKFLIECIRTGLQATYWRLMRDKWIQVQEQHPNGKEAEGWIHAFEHSMFRDDPMGGEVRTAMRQRGAALNRLADILQHVPEAVRRYKLVERLTEIRRLPGNIGGRVWGMGLSTSEIEWQIQMHEKHPSGKLPQHEVKAREAQRKAEDKRRRDDDADKLLGPPYPEE